MSQHDFVIDNGPGLAVRTDMQAAVQALASVSAGPVEPATKYAYQLWMDTGVAQPVIRQRNAANTAWVVPTLGALPLTGGTITGNLTIDSPNTALLVLDKNASGQYSYIEGRTNGVARWQLQLGNQNAESGGNAGSDFAIYRMSDAGAALDVPISISRANGMVTIGQNLTINAGLSVGAGGVSTTGSITASGNIQMSQVLQYSGTVGIFGAVPGSPGIIYFRPNGWNSQTNECTIDTGGTYTGVNVAWGGSGISSSAGQGWFGFSSGANHSRRSGTASQGHINFYNNVMTSPTLVGQIITNGSATSYNTSSDENLKEFIGPYDPAKAIEIIRADPARDFTWKDSGEYAVGWGAQTSYQVSHDLASPPSVTDMIHEMRMAAYAEEYAATPEGEELPPPPDYDAPPTPEELAALPQPGEPGYHPWGMDQAKRTPYLWAALSWALDKIDDLTARVTTLEGNPA